MLRYALVFGIGVGSGAVVSNSLGFVSHFVWWHAVLFSAASYAVQLAGLKVPEHKKSARLARWLPFAGALLGGALIGVGVNI